MKIEAWIGCIGTGHQEIHSVDPDRVNALVRHIKAGGMVPPVLVVEDGGNGCLVLDGHHRLAAVSQLEDEHGEHLTLAAWVVGLEEFDRLLIEHFDGDLPSRISDLDDYILVQGRPYEGRSPA